MKRRDDLVLGPKDKAVEAVRDGRKEEAIQYIEELYQEPKPLHDRYGDWIQSLLGFIAEKNGEGAVEEALKKTFEEVYKERASVMNSLPHAELVKRYCSSLRSHYADFYVEEDDEKTVIYINYCGSGGKLQKEGKPVGASTGKHRWSFNEKGVCFYCCHEAVFQEEYKKLGYEYVQYNYAKQFTEDGKPTGNPCRWVFYKKKGV